MTDNQNQTPIIEAVDLRKSFGTHEVLKGLDLKLNRGEVVALIGPSGSGKSTFIRCLNHMETPTGGQIRFHQKLVGNSFRDKGDVIGFGTLASSSVPVLQAVGITVGPGALLALVLSAVLVYPKPAHPPSGVAA